MISRAIQDYARIVGDWAATISKGDVVRFLRRVQKAGTIRLNTHRRFLVAKGYRGYLPAHVFRICKRSGLIGSSDGLTWKVSRLGRRAIARRIGDTE